MNINIRIQLTCTIANMYSIQNDCMSKLEYLKIMNCKNSLRSIQFNAT